MLQLLENLLGQNVPQSESNKIKISSQNLTMENDISDEVLSNINQNFLDCSCTKNKVQSVDERIDNASISSKIVYKTREKRRKIKT